MNIKLFRLERKEAVIGTLTIDNRVICCTLEHPDLYVRQGNYPLVCEYSPKFDMKLWELKDVPDRTECKFHRGNTIADTEGCIIPGMYAGYMDGVRAVFSSGTALARIHELLDKSQSYVIKISEVL